MKQFPSRSARFRAKVLFIVAVSLFLSVSGSMKAQCGPPLFYEGFESGSIAPTWTALGTFSTFAVSVNTISPHSGNFKLHMSGVSSHLQGIFTTFAPSTPTIVSWHIYPTQVPYASNYFVLGDANVSYSNCLVFCGWMNNNSTSGSIRFTSSSTTFTDYPANNQQWYKIELRNINYTSLTFDIWINNTLFVSAFPFRSNTLTNVSTIHLYNLTAVGSSAWDDIMIGDGMVASPAYSSPHCSGGTDGSATVTAVGGTAPFTYSWSTSSTSSVVSNLQGNTVYTVQVTDANNCISTQTFMLSEPSAISASFVTQSVTCLGYADGQVTVTTSGGTAPYSFTWTNGSIGSKADSLAAGVYSVLVQDANACVYSATVNVTGPQTSVSSTYTVNNVSCFGGVNGSAYVQGNGGAGSYSYSWMPVSGNSALMNNLIAGNYTCVVRDQNQCAFSTFITITEPAEITAQITTSTVTCLGPGGATVTGSGGIPPYTFTWQPTGGNNNTLVTMNPGGYNLKVADSTGCIKNFTLHVSADLTTPTLTVSSDAAAICKGETVTLSVSGNGDDYLWSDGSPGMSITVSPSFTTNYSVTATFTGNGCSSTASFLQMVSDCLGLEENAARNFQIYPNPFLDKLTIISGVSQRYRIYYSDGKLLREGVLEEGENHINMSGLIPGIYLISLPHPADPVSRRVIRLERN